MLRERSLDGVPYGHFGDGCVHVRIDFELEDVDGRARFRSFVEDAATLVASYGGSMSGEHGDGRARSELLPRMYSPEAVALMRQAKRVLDPAGDANAEGMRRMNELLAATPGVSATAVQTVGVKGWDGFCLIRVERA